jgi:putative tricarboxylic transport membrane protein
MLEVLANALALVADPYVLLVIIVSAAFGMFVGSMPGLTATMAVALLVPVTFFMDPVPALAAIVTASSMAIFSGDIPGAMLRMPGTPASAAYVDDSYQMALKGQLNLNLGTNLVVSVVGGLVGVAALVLLAPALAEVALRFTAFEYFWLAALGLSCAIFISSADPVKAFISLLLGLTLATVGIDPTAGVPRFTFGSVDLLAGIDLIPAMIGLFAISEIMRGAIRMHALDKNMPTATGPIFKGVGRVMMKYKLNIARGSLLGPVVGALPGAGADIAAWISYAISKRFSKEPEKYGKGHIEGVVDATAANNSAVGGAWIPALVFGIPGDSITAIVIGVLYMKGMNPGPTVFLENPQFIYAVFMIFIVANLVMIPMGWAVIKSARQLLRIPRQVLLPLILLFCIVGSFAMTNSVYGILLMLGIGAAGWLLEENGFPVAPIILGLVLGGLFERTFMSSMLRTQGDLLGFFERPLAATLGVITLLIWVLTIGKAIWTARRRTTAAPPAA